LENCCGWKGTLSFYLRNGHFQRNGKIIPIGYIKQYQQLNKVVVIWEWRGGTGRAGAVKLLVKTKTSSIIFRCERGHFPSWSLNQRVMRREVGKDAGACGHV
jgi:hypothetical protein